MTAGNARPAAPAPTRAPREPLLQPFAHSAQGPLPRELTVKTKRLISTPLLPLALAALALAACGAENETSAKNGAPPHPSAEPARAAKSGRMESVQFMDPFGFSNPMVAGTAEIPEGWRTKGGIGWDRSSECVGNYIRMKWLAESEDGSEAFEIMPGYTWQLQGTQIAMNPCPALPVRSPREFLQIVVQRYPADARVLEYRDRPDLVQQSAAMPGMQAHMEVGEMLIAYTRDGREVSELLLTYLNFSEMQGNVVVGAPAVYAQRAPKGQLDVKLGEQIRNSLRADRQWVAMMKQSSEASIQRISQNQQARIAAWHASEMGKISARGAAERSRIAMQTSREVAQIYSDGWNRSQATDDRIQRRTLEAIGGYNTYADPAGGGVVRESIEYDRVLRTDGGNYISTDDPNFNPAGTQELERIP